MSRKRTIAIAGITLLAVLAILENLTKTVRVLPATVHEVTSEIPDAGPDIWTVTADLAEGTRVKLTPRTARPTLTSGTSICVRMHKRSWSDPKYQLSAQTVC